MRRGCLHSSLYISDTGREDEECEAPSFRFAELRPDAVNN